MGRTTAVSVYVELFHGRTDPDQDMEDWGDRGPILGPFKFVHTTYAGIIHLGSMDAPGDSVGDLRVDEDMVYYDGVWYGDWSVFDQEVFDALPDKNRERLVPFNESLTVAPSRS
jgi:hypothetical protein